MLLAEIGGYMGLLLGFSLFQFADILTSFLDRKIEKLTSAKNDGVTSVISWFGQDEVRIANIIFGLLG